jgi:exonuclease III
MDIDFLTTTSTITEEEHLSETKIVCRQSDKKILCGSSTLARGLCVGSDPECSIRTLENRTIPDKVVSDDAGVAYGYNVENLGRGCYLNFDELNKDYEQIYPDSEVDIVPENFKLLTYNIWGLAAQEKHRNLFDLRKDFLVQTLDTTDADIYCLQEMSAYSYDKLKNWIGIDGGGSKYKFASEVPYVATNAERNRSVDTYVVAKYRPKRVVTYALPGILGYFNCLSLIEYPNLVIFNIYSQAGGISSPGQENYWIHYSRCRYDLFNMIYDKIRSSYIDQNVIICGDFNCDLDGALPTEGGPKRNIWPELEMINKFKKLGFIDTFRSIQADPRSGLTEDTDLNLMRWNQKFKEKMFRYDAIFYKPATNPANTYQIAASEIMGTEVAYLSEENSRWFIDIISEKKDLALFKGLKYNGEKLPLIPINPSDHFGVITSFAKIPAKQVAKPLEQSGKGYNISSKTKTKYVLRKR